MSMKNPNDRTRDLPAVTQCLIQLRYRAPLTNQVHFIFIHTILSYNQTCSDSLDMILMLSRMMANEPKDVGLSINNIRIRIKCTWLFILFHYVHTRYDKWSAIFARHARINASTFLCKLMVISKKKSTISCTVLQVSNFTNIDSLAFELLLRLMTKTERCLTDTPKGCKRV